MGKFTPNKMDRFHKALPNVKRSYVTLQNFTPDLQKIYTDISVISVTLCNSVQGKNYWLCIVNTIDLRSGENDWILIPPAQEKYNFAIITEHCCEVESAEFEANLKKLDFIENYEVIVF